MGRVLSGLDASQRDESARSMNPYFLLAGVIAWAVSVAGAFFYGQGVGKDSEIATQAREDKVAVIATEAAASAVAHSLSKMQVKNVTIRQQLETQVRENTVYRDCKLDPAIQRLLNSSPGIAPAASAASGG